MNYIISVPADYKTDQAKFFPLLIFLHGVNERGNDITLLKTHGPQPIVDCKPDFPFITLSPQCPLGKIWEFKELQALYEEVINDYRVDINRAYLTGLSMGGFGTWAWASKSPRQFAAIAPICGGGHIEYAKHLIGTPIWAFHGDADTIVPVIRTIEMVEAVNKAGGSAMMTIYKGVGHDSWTATYNNQELYLWLLKQSLFREKS